MYVGYIYTLTDPKSGLVFYIGETGQPDVRKKTHRQPKSESARGCRDRAYDYCLDNSIVPEFEILETVYYVGDSVLRYREEYWIHQFYQWGFPIANRINRRGNPSWDAIKMRQFQEGFIEAV